MSKKDEKDTPERENATEEPVVEAVPEAQVQPEEPDYHSLYQRSLADLENAKKRFDQDKKQLSQFAQLRSALDLLPVVDNFYRATEHLTDTEKQSPWLTGILHIQKQLLDTLDQWGVKEIPAQVGEAFDPARHEATGTALNAEVPEDHILTIQNRGYQLHERVIRPVQVLVSKHGSESPAETK